MVTPQPRIVFVHPIARFSIWDVARGYRSAIGRIVGEENIRDYFLDRHTMYHRGALPEGVRDQMDVVSKLASEAVVTEALYFGADLVLIVSGLNFHPAGLWLLQKVGIPAAVILTESPYEDESQCLWVDTYPGMFVFTNDRVSADRYGWQYLAHAYDPAIHHPETPVEEHLCDVLLVGTGWEERIKLLEGVDWAGITLRLRGLWLQLTESSPIFKFYSPAFVDNATIAKLYSSASICLNIHRDVGGSSGAMSLGPRAYEIAGCEGFQLSDYRPEIDTVFGGSVPFFRTARELEDLIHYYLDRPRTRREMARAAHHCVSSCTFDDRARRLLSVISRTGGRPNDTGPLADVPPAELSPLLQ